VIAHSKDTSYYHDAEITTLFHTDGCLGRRRRRYFRGTCTNSSANHVAAGNGLVTSSIDAHGQVAIGPLVPIDTSAGKPSELCWLAISPDDRSVFATSFGYSNISSYHVDGDEVSIAKDPACPRVPGDGTFRAINGTVSSGPSDNWISPDGAYLYQIYGNASKLVGYATRPDGSLKEIANVRIPYNSPEGLAGF